MNEVTIQQADIKQDEDTLAALEHVRAKALALAPESLIKIIIPVDKAITTGYRIEPKLARRTG